MALIMPQYGIFAQGTQAHHFLEFDVQPGLSANKAVQSFLPLLTPKVSAGSMNAVIGFGQRVWREADPSGAPSSLRDFQEIMGSGGRRAPATQHDVWLWISGSAPDVTFDYARAATVAVREVAKLAAEQPAFAYRDNRDMTGFHDGTENPPVRIAGEAALVPQGQPGEGGSHVLAMRWVHDLAAFNSLPVEQQELVMGRTKRDSIEIPEGERPESAHISRVSVKADGRELKIYRRSVPYGNVQEQGLYFVAFSADPSRYEMMLARMFGVGGDGVHDRLTDFSRPVSGAYYFAPSLNALNKLAGPAPG